jgi:hypothetical protein
VTPKVMDLASLEGRRPTWVMGALPGFRVRAAEALGAE